MSLLSTPWYIGRYVCVATEWWSWFQIATKWFICPDNWYLDWIKLIDDVTVALDPPNSIIKTSTSGKPDTPEMLARNARVGPQNRQETHGKCCWWIPSNFLTRFVADALNWFLKTGGFLQRRALLGRSVCWDRNILPWWDCPPGWRGSRSLVRRSWLQWWRMPKAMQGWRQPWSTSWCLILPIGGFLCVYCRYIDRKLEELVLVHHKDWIVGSHVHVHQIIFYEQTVLWPLLFEQKKEGPESWRTRPRSRRGAWRSVLACANENSAGTWCGKSKTSIF